MEQNLKKWSKLVLLGAADLDAGDLTKAVERYEQAQTLAQRLIDNTIIRFDGDTRPLNLYNYCCYCLVQAHTRAGNSTAVRVCLEQTGRKFLDVLKNTGYPPLMRGKVIREFEPLMNLAMQFYQAEGRADEAYSTVGDWLTEVKQYVSHMRSVDETIWMN